MSDRDCEKCKHHTEKGCDSWNCEFEQRMTKEDIHREKEQAYMQGYEDACKKYRQEPKTGHWIEQIDYEENCRTLICSNCDRPALHDEDSIWKHKFCPHCGAKMVEPQESEEV